MALQFRLQLVVIADDEQVSVDELVVLHKDHERLEQLGLTLAEVKALLAELQRLVLTRQIAAFLASRTACAELWSTPGRQRAHDHPVPNLVRQAGVGQPAAQALSAPAVRAGVH